MNKRNVFFPAALVVALFLPAALQAQTSCAPPPQARIFIAYTGTVSGCTATSGTCSVGEIIQFQAQAFGYAFQEGCDGFEWQFGDGSTASGKSVSHAYQAGGTYAAALRVSNISGNATVEAAVRVGAESASCTQPASRRFQPYFENETCSPSSGPCRFGQAITFSVRGDLQACDTFSWSFGNGASQQGATAAYNYGATGPYTVVLTVTNPTGSVSRAIGLEVSTPPSTLRTAASSIALVAPAGQLSNAASIALFTATGDVPWTAEATSWIRLSATAGTVGDRQGATVLTVVADTAELPPGEHTGFVTFTGGTAGPISIPVTLRVVPAAGAGLQPVALSVREIEFFGHPIRELTLGLTNNNTEASVTWDLRSPFLVFSPASGTLAPGTSVVIPVIPATVATTGFGTTSHFVDVFTNGRITSSIPVRITTAPDPAFTTRGTAAPGSPMPGGKVVLPALGSNLPGAGGSLWTSDVFLTSLPWTVSTNQTTFTYTPIGVPNGGDSLRVTDSVQNPMTMLSSPITHVFLQAGGFGALEMQPEAPLGAWSRIYTSAAAGDGTYGQDLPGFREGDNSVIRAGQTGIIPVLLGGRFRTNLMMAEIGGHAVTVTVSVRNAAGDTVRAHSVSLTPWEQRPINDVLAGTGLDTGYAELTITGEGSLGAFASLVDNSTNDPTTVLMSRGGAGRIVIPGALHAPGVAGTTWRTDVWLVNSGTAPLVFRPVLHAAGTTNGLRQYSVAPRAQVSLTDIVAADFGRDAIAGAVLFEVISGDPAAARVFSRTFNVGGSGGTFGQGIAAARADDAIGRGEPALTLFGLQRNRSFRTNLQLQETAGAALSLQIEAQFITPGGIRTGPKVNLSLEPFQYRQIGDILGLLGFPDDGYDPRLTIRVLSGEGKVMAYGAIVDNTTGDPTTVPAFRLVP